MQRTRTFTNPLLKGIKMKIINQVAAACAFAGLVVCASASAQTNTPSFNILSLATGWGVDQFNLRPVGGNLAGSNPANCPSVDGYAARSQALNAEPNGYKTHLSTVQLAFALGKPISITLANGAGDCLDGRPRIIGVSINM
jgi:hypothetical protein